MEQVRVDRGAGEMSKAAAAQDTEAEEPPDNVFNAIFILDHSRVMQHPF